MAIKENIRNRNDPTYAKQKDMKSTSAILLEDGNDGLKPDPLDRINDEASRIKMETKHTIAEIQKSPQSLTDWFIVVSPFFFMVEGGRSVSFVIF